MTDLDAALAGELSARGENPDGWTVIEDVLLGAGLHTEERRLVVCNDGRHYVATYERAYADGDVIVARFERLGEVASA